VQMEPSDAYDVICCIPAPSLAYTQPGMCYTLVQMPQDDPTAGTNQLLKCSGCGIWVHTEIPVLFFSSALHAGFYVGPMFVQNSTRDFFN